MDVYQWCLMISTHAQRHILQIREIKAHGVVACASLTPQRVRAHYEIALEAGIAAVGRRWW